MFKVVFLVCGVLAVLIQARPSYLPSYEHVEYAPSVVGYESYALPAAVSTRVPRCARRSVPYWRPIVIHSPILKPAYAPATSISYAPLGYAGSSAEWYEPGIWGGASYPSIYLK
ncbi:GM25613 [Drosophila sechellia]|uniref:GM25613 n=1 Tax=Drosophila sechellia TaxID=7238 RepID=B4HJ65_DROSE|nr:GM25613 [Drosophila sechellia]